MNNILKILKELVNELRFFGLSDSEIEVIIKKTKDKGLKIEDLLFLQKSREEEENG